MKRLAICVLAGMCWISLGAAAWAQDEGQAKDPWELPKTEEKKTEEQPAETGTAETGTTEETTPQVVTPSGYPIAEIDRPLALPRMVLEPRFNFGFDFVKNTDNLVFMGFGAGFGIIDHLEAGLDLPLLLSPEVKAGDMDLYGLYEIGPLLDGKLHLAGRANFIIGLSDYFRRYDSDFVFLADLPAKFKLHDMIAATADVALGFTSGSQNDHFLLFIDIGALVQPMEALALSWYIGFHNFMGDNGGTAIPMYLKGQYTLMGDLDIYAEFGFGDLNHAGADHVQLIFGAAYRLGL